MTGEQTFLFTNGWRRIAAWLGMGCALSLVVTVVVWQQMRAFSPAHSVEFLQVQLLAQTVLLFLLPLPLMRAGSAAPSGWTATAWVGGALVGTLIAAVLGGGAYVAPLWGTAICAAVSALVCAVGGRFSGSLTQRRRLPFGAAVLWLFFLAAPFCMGELTRLVPLEQEAGAQTLAVWCAPMMQLSVAWPGLDLGVMPRMYTMWLGPQTPYPSHPAWIVLGYGGLALLVWGINWIYNGWRLSTDAGTSH